MIKTVIKYSNNVVMIFDEMGEQIPEYQGQYEEMKEKILRDAPPSTMFAYWFNHHTKPETVSRERW